MVTSSPRIRLPRDLIYNTKGSSSESSSRKLYTHQLRHPFSHTIIFHRDTTCFFPADLGPFALLSRIWIGIKTNNTALVLMHRTKKKSLDDTFIVTDFRFTTSYIPHDKLRHFFFFRSTLTWSGTIDWVGGNIIQSCTFGSRRWFFIVNPYTLGGDWSCRTGSVGAGEFRTAGSSAGCVCIIKLFVPSMSLSSCRPWEELDGRRGWVKNFEREMCAGRWDLAAGRDVRSSRGAAVEIVIIRVTCMSN